MSKHTPGPWSVHPMAPTAVHQPELSCWIPQSEADARLIAAAPRMYEYITSAASNGCAEAKKIIAAIAKADGKP